MLIIKKLTKQYAPCPSASIMILQKGIAISLEGRHLVLTLLASIILLCYIYINYNLYNMFILKKVSITNITLDRGGYFIMKNKTSRKRKKNIHRKIVWSNFLIFHTKIL